VFSTPLVHDHARQKQNGELSLRRVSIILIIAIQLINLKIYQFKI
jgi:hypothetical protein